MFHSSFVSSSFYIALWYFYLQGNLPVKKFPSSFAACDFCKNFSIVPMKRAAFIKWIECYHRILWLTRVLAINLRIIYKMLEKHTVWLCWTCFSFWTFIGRVFPIKATRDRHLLPVYISIACAPNILFNNHVDNCYSKLTHSFILFGLNGKIGRYWQKWKCQWTENHREYLFTVNNTIYPNVLNQ